MESLTVSADLCKILVDFSEKSNIPTEQAFKISGIRRDAINNSYERIDLHAFGLMWNTLITASGDEQFGLKFGYEGYSLKGGGLLSSILRNCQTLGMAIEKLIRYHDLISRGLSRLKLITENNTATLSIIPLESIFPVQKPTSESITGVIYGCLQELTDHAFKLREVHFNHPGPEEKGIYEEIFKTELYFEQPETKLVFDSQQLDTPIFMANELLLENLQLFASKQLEEIRSKNRYSFQVKHRILQAFLQGDKAGVDEIASDLYMSKRSLQAKLQEEHTTYQDLLEEVRKHLAMQYITKTETTLHELAFMLAYSDQSAFSNAFKKWTGMSPSEYRVESRE